MGNYLSFQLPFRLPFQQQPDGQVEEFNGSESLTYRFPPMKSASYFASHFVMAGEKFENQNQETFLFGENNDLNYLPSKPSTFPYQMVHDKEPSETIRCLIHLRKDSLKLIKEDVAGSEDTNAYRIEFQFDSDVDCSVQVFLMATEVFTHGDVTYTARQADLASEPVIFAKGVGQFYNSKNFLIKPTDFTQSELNYIPSSRTTEIPLVIKISVEDPDFEGQSESTLAGIEMLSEEQFTIKFLKQKIMIDGFCLMTQEIYGIENKSKQQKTDDDVVIDDDSSSDCCICFENLRDTLMLPCRHLCLCSICAEKMRTSESRCPMCRANFHALLQLKTVRKTNVENELNPTYEPVAVIEALNGIISGEPSEEVLSHRSQSSVRSQRRSSRKSAKSAKGSRPNSQGSKIDRNASKDENVADTGKTTLGEKHEVAVEIEDKYDKKDLYEIVVDKSENDTEPEEKPNEHVDQSLPNAPMGSSGDDCSSLSTSMTGSTSLLISSSSSMFATKVQVTTPTNICDDISLKPLPPGLEMAEEKI